jgi:hypothetical protein
VLRVKSGEVEVVEPVEHGLFVTDAELEHCDGVLITVFAQLWEPLLVAGELGGVLLAVLGEEVADLRECEVAAEAELE